MASNEEEIDFREEARSIIADVNFAVEHIALSERLKNSKDCVHVNIKTLEGKIMCVQLDTNGLKVVGDDIDTYTYHINPKSFESIYSLLDSVSPGYVRKFGEKLAGRLADLQE